MMMSVALASGAVWMCVHAGLAEADYFHVCIMDGLRAGPRNHPGLARSTPAETRSNQRRSARAQPRRPADSPPIPYIHLDSPRGRKIPIMIPITISGTRMAAAALNMQRRPDGRPFEDMAGGRARLVGLLAQAVAHLCRVVGLDRWSMSTRIQSISINQVVEPGCGSSSCSSSRGAYRTTEDGHGPESKAFDSINSRPLASIPSPHPTTPDPKPLAHEPRTIRA